MTCRCATPQIHAERAAADAAASYRKREEALAARTPDASRFDIEDVAQVGRHLVMRVKYPNCVKCAYEGLKVMVFLNVGLQDAIKWKRIDPHFRAPIRHAQPLTNYLRDAPSPAARFPGSSDGWADALAYAKAKNA
jgi:hypothetical protein